MKKKEWETIRGGNIIQGRILIKVCNMVTRIRFYFRWKKCKSKLSGLTNTDGHHRPGQAGTTGQLFFTKCGDPPEGCECKYEEPTGRHSIPEFPSCLTVLRSREYSFNHMNRSTVDISFLSEALSGEKI